MGYLSRSKELVVGYTNKKFKAKNLLYESFLADIDREMNKAARRQRTKAGKHVKKKLKQKTTQKFGADSNITKGIGLKNLKKTTIVGVGPPAQAAHLIEFGTDERYHESGKYTGRIKADPFMIPVYREESPVVQQILAKEWF